MKTTFLSLKLSTLCKDRGMSYEQLAEKSKLSLEQINLILDRDSFPSLAPLIKITRALGVRLGTLLDDSNVVGPVVQRAAGVGNASVVTSQLMILNSNLDFFSLASNKADRNMEPFLIDVKPLDPASLSLSSHEGEEFIFVINGSICVQYGNESYVLNQGDSIYYDSILPHLVSAANDFSAQILAIVYVPC